MTTVYGRRRAVVLAVVPAVVLSLGLGVATVQAQTTDHGAHTSTEAPMPMPMPTNQAAADASPSTKANMEAMQKMHSDMAVDYSGNADLDFAKGMIPHHQGAIAMARIELEYGKNPQMRAMAEEIIKAQEAEIATLRAWIAENGATSP